MLWYPSFADTRKRFSHTHKHRMEDQLQLCTMLSWFLVPQLYIAHSNQYMITELEGGFSRDSQQNTACENQPFQYCNHVLDCSVLCAIVTRNHETAENSPAPSLPSKQCGRYNCGGSRLFISSRVTGEWQAIHTKHWMSNGFTIHQFIVTGEARQRWHEPDTTHTCRYHVK